MVATCHHRKGWCSLAIGSADLVGTSVMPASPGDCRRAGRLSRRTVPPQSETFIDAALKTK